MWDVLMETREPPRKFRNQHRRAALDPMQPQWVLWCLPHEPLRCTTLCCTTVAHVTRSPLPTLPYALAPKTSAATEQHLAATTAYCRVEHSRRRTRAFFGMATAMQH